MGPSLSCLALLSFVLFQKTRGGKGQENIFWIHFIKRMEETLLTKFKSNSRKLRAGGSPAPTLLAWQVPPEVGEESGWSRRGKQREATLTAEQPTQPGSGVGGREGKRQLWGLSGCLLRLRRAGMRNLGVPGEEMQTAPITALQGQAQDVPEKKPRFCGSSLPAHCFSHFWDCAGALAKIRMTTTGLLKRHPRSPCVAEKETSLAAVTIFTPAEVFCLFSVEDAGG